jgi:hypothetical protein
MTKPDRIGCAVILLFAGSSVISLGQAPSRPSSAKPSPTASPAGTTTSVTPAGCVTSPGDGISSSGDNSCQTATTRSQSTVPQTSNAAGGSHVSGAGQGFLNGMTKAMTDLAKRGSVLNTGNADGSCYWSSKWGGLGPDIQAGLHQHERIDAAFSKLGGPAQLIAYAETPGNLEKEFANLQGEGGPEAEVELQLIAAGFVDVARCRMGPSGYLVTAKPSLIDAGSFKAAGTDAIDQQINSLLDGNAGCDELINYRDNQLEKEFDLAMTNRDLFKAQKENDFLLAQNTLNIMNDQWWAGQTVAQLAIYVKLADDEAKAVLSALAPESLAVNTIDTAADNTKLTIDIVHSESTNLGKKASDDGYHESMIEAFKAAAWKIGDKLSPVSAILHGQTDFIRNQEGMDSYQAEVQEQVGALISSARNWHDKEKEQQSKADSIAKIKKQITDYCSVQPQANTTQPPAVINPPD